MKKHLLTGKYQQIVKFLMSMLLTAGLTSLTALSVGAEDLRDYYLKYKDAEINDEAMIQVGQYNDLISYYTNFSYFTPEQRVNPDFIRALILAESGGEAQAVSPKDAFGLCQIILTTGQMAGKELYKLPIEFDFVSKEKLKHIRKQDLFDPAINILLTCYLIAKYNYRYDGKLELVLSAWNAGENISSLAKGKHAPYRETKNLIGKVNGYYLYLLKQNREAIRKEG